MKTNALNLLLTIGLAAAAWADDVARPIPGSAEEVQPLAIGAPAPAVTLQTAAGEAFDLGAAVRRQPAMLIFYRGGWCPYCNVHLGQLQEAEAEIRALGYQVLAISPDRPEKLAESAGKLQPDYTLLSDHAMAAALGFGIAFRVDDATLETYKGYGIDLEAASGETHHLLPVPAVFIVGTDGWIRFAYANPDYKVRLSPEELLAAAKDALTNGEEAP